MKKQPNKKTVALFIILGFAVFAGLIFKKMVDEYFFDKQKLVVMYFNESIKGLNVGSPVVYEGVQVGKVAEIAIVPDATTLGFSIPVSIMFSEDKDISYMAFADNMKRRAFLEMLIEKGLRARLTSLNFLTGQLMIELYMAPDSPAVFKQSEKEHPNLEIPTTLSTIGNLSKDFQDLPLKKIVWRFDEVLKILEKDLPPLIGAYADLGNKLNKYADKSLPQTSQTLNNLNAVLKDISAASKSVKNLTDYLERHPDSVLKGKK